MALSPLAEPFDAQRPHAEGANKLRQLDRVISGFAYAILGLFVLTIALIAMAQGGYVHPALPICAFGAILPACIIIKVLDSCREHIAKKYHIELKVFDAAPNPALKDTGSDSSSESISR